MGSASEWGAILRDCAPLFFVCLLWLSCWGCGLLLFVGAFVGVLAGVCWGSSYVLGVVAGVMAVMWARSPLLGLILVARGG